LQEAGRWAEADSSMLTDPGRHWPFEWNPRRLVVQHMDALELRYDDESMDGVFSSSSIEHFGDFDAVSRSASEMFRVLKPNGILALSTELCVDGPATRWSGGTGTLLMDAEAISECIVGAHDWELVSPLDLYVSDPTLATEQSFEALAAAQHRQVAAAGGYFPHLIELPKYPHIVVESRGYSWTSIHLALRKRRR
jgi:SAM-dependent methyltransferase